MPTIDIVRKLLSSESLDQERFFFEAGERDRTAFTEHAADVLAPSQESLQKVVSFLPRWFDLTDSQLAVLIHENNLSLVEPLEGPLGVTLRFETGSATRHQDEQHLDLGELAIASAISAELAVRLTAASEPFGVAPERVVVTVSSGTTQVTFSGSRLALAIGVVVACSTGVVDVPIAAGVATPLLAFGLVDMLLEWRHKQAEYENLRADTKLKRQQTRQIRESSEDEDREPPSDRPPSGGGAQSDRPSAQRVLVLPDGRPYSSLVHPGIVLEHSRNIGANIFYVNQILNHGLPPYLIARSMVGPISVSSQERGAGAGAH